MGLQPDPRWQNFIAGFDERGQPQPMTVEALEALVEVWAEIVAGLDSTGSLELLGTARALVVQSWFRYELLVQASLVSLQAVEAAFRTVLYPNEPANRPLKKLVAQATRERIFGAHEAESLRAAVEMRNALSHPDGQTAYSPGMAGTFLETSHLVVRDIHERCTATNGSGGGP